MRTGDLARGVVLYPRLQATSVSAQGLLALADEGLVFRPRAGARAPWSVLAAMHGRTCWPGPAGALGWGAVAHLPARAPMEGKVRGRMEIAFKKKRKKKHGGLDWIGGSRSLTRVVSVSSSDDSCQPCAYCTYTTCEFGLGYPELFRVEPRSTAVWFAGYSNLGRTQD